MSKMLPLALWMFPTEKIMTYSGRIPLNVGILQYRIRLWVRHLESLIRDNHKTAKKFKIKSCFSYLSDR